MPASWFRLVHIVVCCYLMMMMVMIISINLCCILLVPIVEILTCVPPLHWWSHLKGKNQIGYYAYTDESLYLVWTPANPSPPYTKAITRCRKCVSSFAKNHKHFPIKAWLKLPTPSDPQQWVNEQNSTPPKGIWTTLLRHPTRNIYVFSLAYLPQTGK